MSAKYRLTNIHLWGNEHGQLRRDTAYAELRLCADGGLEMSATLEEVLAAIRDRKLDVEGVTVEEKPTFRGPISVVSIRDGAAPPVLTEREQRDVKDWKAMLRGVWGSQPHPVEVILDRLISRTATAAPPVLTEEERAWVEKAREIYDRPRTAAETLSGHWPTYAKMIAIIDRLTGGEGGSTRG